MGGGFARYATDAAWLVPHFEKMLYDNGLLLSALAYAYRGTGEPLFRARIDETVELAGSRDAASREAASPQASTPTPSTRKG